MVLRPLDRDIAQRDVFSEVTIASSIPVHRQIK